MEQKAIPLQVIQEHAAGIDIGSRTHVVAVDQNQENVRSFGVYTKDHEQLISYLQQFGITSVAMESTGTYWQTLFNALQRAGFEVILVGGSQTKNVKGRKTDVIDAIWIQKLHSLGLLSGSFLLSDVLQELRTYYTHRQHVKGWSKEFFIGWAQEISPVLVTFLEKIFLISDHPEQAYKSCSGIQSLYRTYKKERLCNACMRAMAFDRIGYKALAGILKTGSDMNPELTFETRQIPIHDNVRGGDYYTNKLTN